MSNWFSCTCTVEGVFGQNSKLSGEIPLGAMLRLASKHCDSIHDAFDLIWPLITRRIAVDWRALTRGGQDSQSAMRALGTAIDFLPPAGHGDAWGENEIVDWLDRFKDAIEYEPKWNEMVKLALLFEPTPLLVSDAARVLGPVECRRRLTSVREQLRLLTLIG